MRKEFFTKEATYLSAPVPDCEQFIIQTGDQKISLMRMTRDIKVIPGWDLISMEQLRLDPNGYENPIETCFLINWENFSIKSISVHLIDYNNELLSFMLKGTDDVWWFTYNIPLPCYNSVGYLQQLVHLYNQENLYFYIHKWGEITGQFEIKNPFQFSEEIEALLLRIDIEKVKRNDSVLAVENIVKFFDFEPFFEWVLERMTIINGSYLGLSY